MLLKFLLLPYNSHNQCGSDGDLLGGLISCFQYTNINKITVNGQTIYQYALMEEM